MNNNLFVNGFRTDTINNLNYLKLIQDSLYIGFLGRNNIAWGDAVLAGIEIDSTDLSTYILPAGATANADYSNSFYYITLFNTDETDEYTNKYWKVFRINEKWVLFGNKYYTISDKTLALKNGSSVDSSLKKLIVKDDDISTELVVGQQFILTDNTAPSDNSGTYTVSSITLTGTDTIIIVDEAIPATEVFSAGDATIEYNLATQSTSEVGKYLNYVSSLNLEPTSMYISYYSIATPAIIEKLNYPDPSEAFYIPIRTKNSDKEFYNANKTVYLSSSGMITPVEGFDSLILLENSKDPATIKIINLPEETISKIETEISNLKGRRFDVIDKESDKILIKGIVYNELITLGNTSILKFTYPTQKGDKAVLVTTNVYEDLYSIFPDLTVDLVTETVNDNMAAGLDIAYLVDNFIYESLFLEETVGAPISISDLDFIKNAGNITPVYFASLANENNRQMDGYTGQFIDDSIYIAKEYSAGNWNDIKEYNLNKLYLSFKLEITTGAADPVSGTDYELFYNTTDEQLKYWIGSAWVNISNEIRQIAVFYINKGALTLPSEISDDFVDLVYLTNINKIKLIDTTNIQLII